MKSCEYTRKVMASRPQSAATTIAVIEANASSCTCALSRSSCVRTCRKMSRATNSAHAPSRMNSSTANTRNAPSSLYVKDGSERLCWSEMPYCSVDTTQIRPASAMRFTQ